MEHPSIFSSPLTRSSLQSCNTASSNGPEPVVLQLWNRTGGGCENQVFITPGVVLGRIRLYGRLTLTVGTGYQFAVSEAHPQYENNWIFSVRTNF
jgi:hypothetical protein